MFAQLWNNYLRYFLFFAFFTLLQICFVESKFSCYRIKLNSLRLQIQFFSQFYAAARFSWPNKLSNFFDFFYWFSVFGISVIFHSIYFSFFTYISCSSSIFTLFFLISNTMDLNSATSSDLTTNNSWSLSITLTCKTCVPAKQNSSTGIAIILCSLFL